MPNPETGIIPGPEGYQIAWSREDVSPEAARLFRREAKARSYRVLTYKGTPDGSAIMATWGVPGPILDAFLFDLAGEPETVDEVLSVEAID